MKFRILTSCLFISSLCLPSFIRAQKPEKQEKEKGILTVGFDYKSATTYKGRLNDSIPQPSFSPYVKYAFNSGIFLSGRYYRVLNADSLSRNPTNEFDLGIGYKKKFTKKLKGKVSYTHYFFGENVSLIKASFSNDAAASLSYDWNILYSEVYTDYSWGDESDFFLSIDNSHDFSWDDVFKTDDNFTFSPEVDLDFGTQNFYNRYLTEKKLGKKKGKNTKPQNQYTVSSRFALSAIDLLLPLSYSIGDLTLDVSLNIIKPKNQPLAAKSRAYTYLTAGIAYDF